MHRATIDWKSKLHPAFVEMADAYKRMSLELAVILKEAKLAEDALGSLAVPEQMSQIAKRVITKKDDMLQRFDREFVDIDSRYKPLPASLLCYSYMPGLRQREQTAETESRTFKEWLHWQRHHESLQRAEGEDKQGNLNAFERIVRTLRDWRTIFFKKGAIKAFQYGTEHQDIFEIGLSFASGMEKLTGEELADFFDCMCPSEECEQFHDARALQKQLARLIKDLEAAAQKS